MIINANIVVIKRCIQIFDVFFLSSREIWKMTCYVNGLIFKRF